MNRYKCLITAISAAISILVLQGIDTVYAIPLVANADNINITSHIDRSACHPGLAGVNPSVVGLSSSNAHSINGGIGNADIGFPPPPYTGSVGDIYSSARSGANTASGSIPYGFAQVPVSIPCRDYDVDVSMSSTAVANAPTYGKNFNRVAFTIDLGVNPYDTRDVGINDFLVNYSATLGGFGSSFQLDIGLGRAGSIFNVLYSVPETPGNALSVESSTHSLDALGTYSYDENEQLYKIENIDFTVLADYMPDVGSIGIVATTNATTVPEPGTILFFVFGLLGFAMLHFRGKQDVGT